VSVPSPRPDAAPAPEPAPSQEVPTGPDKSGVVKAAVLSLVVGGLAGLFVGIGMGYSARKYLDHMGRGI
jgi:hypothetical protein